MKQIVIKKTELSDEEKRDLLVLIDEERDRALKEKIEQSEQLSRDISLKKQDLIALNVDCDDKTTVVTNLIRDVDTQTTRYNSLKNQADTEQARLNTIRATITNSQFEFEKTTQSQIQAKEQIASELRAVDEEYSRLRNQFKEEFAILIIDMAKKREELKSLAFLETKSKGYFIQILQNIMDERKVPINVLKELGKKSMV